GVRAGRTAITRLPIPQAPALVRLDDQLVAVDADAAVLRDVAGRSRLLHGDRVVIDDRWQGPYRLGAPDGTLLAISPRPARVRGSVHGPCHLPRTSDRGEHRQRDPPGRGDRRAAAPG